MGNASDYDIHIYVHNLVLGNYKLNAKEKIIRKKKYNVITRKWNPYFLLEANVIINI